MKPARWQDVVIVVAVVALTATGVLALWGGELADWWHGGGAHPPPPAAAAPAGTST